jgi:hypothetical protein
LSGRTSKRPRFPGWRRSRMAPSQDSAAARCHCGGREKYRKGERRNVNTTGYSANGRLWCRCGSGDRLLSY